MMESSWLSLVTVFAYRLPMIVIWLIGASFAIARWQRHPRVSVFVLCACALSMGAMVSQVVGQVFLVRMLAVEHVRRIFMVMGIVSSAVYAGATGLLISAAFVDRSTATGPVPTKLPPVRNEEKASPPTSPIT